MDLLWRKGATWVRNSVYLLVDRGTTPTTSRINLSNPSEAELQHLSEACRPATFGLSQENVYDESYRKALQMNTSDFATKFAVADSSLMDVVRSELLEGHESKKAINVELYKLNVYGEAGHNCVTCLSEVFLRSRSVL
jgi:hypothetical protein